MYLYIYIFIFLLQQTSLCLCPCHSEINIIILHTIRMLPPTKCPLSLFQLCPLYLLFPFIYHDPTQTIPSKIEWDLTNGPLSKLLELLDTHAWGRFSGSCWRFLGTIHVCFLWHFCHVSTFCISPGVVGRSRVFALRTAAGEDAGERISLVGGEQQLLFLLFFLLLLLLLW